jgi:methyltransferase (TIGR00027 family)
MKASRSSKTAMQMALSRAIEARRPAGERICFDPLAERFLDRRYRAVLVARPLRDAVEAIVERLFPGHHHYVLVRTRYIDDFLGEQLAAGATQLVILGAGFDSRAHRFADRLRHVTVFEVDHPATTAAKQARIARVLGDAAAKVTYVPVDFDRDVLGVELARRGYRSDRRTIFLWEGVTAYVSAAGVDATLQLIRSSSGPGSVVLFDYVLRSVLEGTCALRGAKNEHDRMARTPEPFVFGIEADEIEAFLSARGFADVCDVGADDLRARYLRDARVTRYVKPWWRIVHATIGSGRS